MSNEVMTSNVPSRTKSKRTNWPVTIGVGAVLLFFFSVPLTFILYGGAGAAIGGAIILAPFLAVQYVIFRVFRRRFPQVTMGKPDEDGD